MADVTPIAIVGMGGIFPDAPDLGAFARNIFAGRDAARPAPPGRWILDPRDAVLPNRPPLRGDYRGVNPNKRESAKTLPQPLPEREGGLEKPIVSALTVSALL